MRTTVRLDDELYRQIKVKAARSGRPIGAVIEDLIRASLAAGSKPLPGPLPPLPVFGKEGPMPGVDLADNAAVADLLDQGVALDARR